MAWYVPASPEERSAFDGILSAAFPSAINGDLSSQEVLVPGKEAVRFLTTSKLPREALRAMWTLVDPNHDGKLTKRSQFHALLRLVAIGQYQKARGVLNVNVPPNVIGSFAGVSLNVPEFEGFSFCAPSSLGGLQDLGSLPAAVPPKQAEEVKEEVKEEEEEEEEDFGEFSAPMSAISSTSGDPDEFGDFEDSSGGFAVAKTQKPSGTVFSMDALSFSMDDPAKEPISKKREEGLKKEGVRRSEEKGASPCLAPITNNTSAMSKLSVFDDLAEADLAAEAEEFGDFENHNTASVANDSNVAVENDRDVTVPNVAKESREENSNLTAADSGMNGKVHRGEATSVNDADKLSAFDGLAEADLGAVIKPGGLGDVEDRKSPTSEMFQKKEVVLYNDKSTWVSARITGVHLDDGPDKPYYTINFMRGSEEIEKQTTNERLRRMDETPLANSVKAVGGNDSHSAVRSEASKSQPLETNFSSTAVNSSAVAGAFPNGMKEAEAEKSDGIDISKLCGAFDDIAEADLATESEEFGEFGDFEDHSSSAGAAVFSEASKSQMLETNFNSTAVNSSVAPAAFPNGEATIAMKSVEVGKSDGINVNKLYGAFDDLAEADLATESEEFGDFEDHSAVTATTIAQSNPPIFEEAVPAVPSEPFHNVETTAETAAELGLINPESQGGININMLISSPPANLPQSAPPPPPPNEDEVNDDSDFGDFEGVGESSDALQAKIPPAAPVPQSTPPPPHLEETGDDKNDSAGDDDDDDFGDFVGMNGGSHDVLNEGGCESEEKGGLTATTGAAPDDPFSFLGSPSLEPIVIDESQAKKSAPSTNGTPSQARTAFDAETVKSCNVKDLLPILVKCELLEFAKVAMEKESAAEAQVDVFAEEMAQPVDEEVEGWKECVIEKRYETIDGMKRELQALGVISKIDEGKTISDVVEEFGRKFGELGAVFARDPDEAIQLQKKAKRAVFVRREVRRGYDALVSSWGNIFRVVHEEFTIGSVLISEAESKGDDKEVLEDERFVTFKGALGEYGRLCKMIWSTIDAMRFGCGGIGLVEGRETELELANFFESLGSVPGGEVEEYTKLGIEKGLDGGSDGTCKITLLPLGVEGYNAGVLSTVHWQGGKYFSVAANLWTNKVSLQQPN